MGALLLLGGIAQGAKLDWSTGYFKLTSKTPTASGSVTSYSTYQIALRHALLSQIEIEIGYTLNFAKFFSGDMGYGPDMGLLYYPLGSASRTNLKNGDVYLEQFEPIRPFVIMQFHQRQFQSIQASYAGFSVGGGVEYWFSPPFGLRLWGNALRLRGPLQSTASETNLLIGLSVEF